MTTSSDFIEHFKLETQWHEDHTLHVSYRSVRSRGHQKLRIEDRWYRKQKLGQGAFGTVWLETNSDGADRAVKEIGRDHGFSSLVDYKRELLAMAKLSKVRVGLWDCFNGANYVTSSKSCLSSSMAGLRAPRIYSYLWSTYLSGISMRVWKR